MAVEVRIIPHPQSTAHVLVKVYSRGRVWATTWAKPFPTEDEVMEVWKDKNQRKMTFLPFDECCNRFLPTL